MSSKGILIIAGFGLRIAGVKDPTTGVQYGGTYIPAHQIVGQGGNIQKYPARFETTIYVNRPNYTDGQGNVRETKNVPIRIVAWNSDDAKPGKGLADTFAKSCSPGKEFGAEFDLKHYKKRVWDNGNPIIGSDGNPILVDAYNLQVTGEFSWSGDASQQIAAEIQNYNPAFPFSGRPQYWDTPGTQDNATWLNQVIPSRSMAVYDGAPTFGYARVRIPEGATPLLQGNNVGMHQPVQQYVQQNLQNNQQHYQQGNQQAGFQQYGQTTLQQPVYQNPQTANTYPNTAGSMTMPQTQTNQYNPNQQYVQGPQGGQQYPQQNQQNQYPPHNPQGQYPQQTAAAGSMVSNTSPI